MNNLIEKKLHYWQEANVVDVLKNSIRKGEISITSTDTILGFLANLSEQSFLKLNNLKERRSDKPCLILISDISKLNNFVDLSFLDQQAHNLLKNCWPGPVTIIFKAKENLPKFLTSKDGTVALRCPNHKFLSKLLTFFDGLFSTSANKTQNPAPIKVQEIEHDLLERIEYLVIDQETKNNLIVDTKRHFDQNLPSSIIDISCKNEIKVIRSGAYPIGELEKFYGSKFKKSE